ncbi:MAG: urease accessory protein [Bacteroidia bacterium]|nr:urease accessory protein [Bacteroidia bacterium]
MLITIFFALTTGFLHAFEADHLVAVSAIVTRRQRMILAVKDGIAWGLGHTSTIMVIGILIIAGRLMLAEEIFHYLEAGVGLMLIGLGINRLRNALRHTPGHTHDAHTPPVHGHRLAYGVGLVHGLAGSGSLVLLVMSQIPEPGSAMAYLFTFGLGSVLGMLVASGAFSLPLSRELRLQVNLRPALTLVSAVLCLGVGIQVVYENLLA